MSSHVLWFSYLAKRGKWSSWVTRSGQYEAIQLPSSDYFSYAQDGLLREFLKLLFESDESNNSPKMNYKRIEQKKGRPHL